MQFLVSFIAFSMLAFSTVYYGSLVLWALMSSRAAAKRSGSGHLRDVETAADTADLGVSIVMPVYNEGPVIASAVRNLWHQTHQKMEIIIVNDGSTDDTLERLITGLMLVEEPLAAPGPIPSPQILAMYRSEIDPRIRVVHQENSGSKAGGTNSGINLATMPWVVVRDGDELMEPDVLSRCLAEIHRSSGNVVAVGASLLPANDVKVQDDLVVSNRTSRNLWVGAQTIEYLTSFFLTRPGMAELGVLPFVSGGYGMFKRQTLIDVGGLVPDHMGEDLEVCLQIHEYHLERDLPYEVRHVPAAVVWTEFPSTYSVLRRQRRRWQWGLQASVSSHRKMLTGRRYGRLGRVGYGTMHVFEWWGGFIEATGWVALTILAIGGWISPLNALALFLSAQAIGTAVMASSVFLTVRRIRWFDGGRDIAWLFLWVAVAGFGFRQLALWWRIVAVGADVREWGEMTRQGFVASEAAA